MATKVLLKKDIRSLGQKGDIVSVRPGFARNFLCPEGMAIIAGKNTLQIQRQLQEEREKQVVIDKKESEEIASRIEGMTVLKVVKVDHEGHLYGSVTVADIQHLIQDKANVELEKHSIQLKHPIKVTGVQTITIKLKEGVIASCHIKVMSEEDYKATGEEAS